MASRGKTDSNLIYAEYESHLLPPSQDTRRNYLRFKDQETHLILSLNTITTVSIYVPLERARLISWDMNKKWLGLISWDGGSTNLASKYGLAQVSDEERWHSPTIKCANCMS
jgi:hypothetical protein